MDLSIKVKIAINKNLKAIYENSFTEVNLKELLIDIREFINHLGILREIADSIAHQYRDRGMHHDSIDIFYAKMKICSPTTSPYNLVLNKIPKKLYDTLFKAGVNKIEDHELFESTKLRKTDLINIIKKNYKIRENFAYLDNKYKIDELQKGIDFLIRHISSDEIFTQEEVINQLQDAVRYLQQFIGFEHGYITAIKANANDLIICLISLLHDTKVVLFDNEIGVLKISTYVKENESSKQIMDCSFISLSASVLLEKNPDLELLFYIIKTQAMVKDYIPKLNFEEKKPCLLEEFCTERVDAKLVLVRP